MEQEKYDPFPELKRDDEGTFRKENLIWIQKESTKTKLKIVVKVHCGEHGHGVYAAMLKCIQGTYWWIDLKQDIEEFT